jgi:hypothetical protein
MHNSLMICLALCLLFGNVNQPYKETLQTDATTAGFYKIRPKDDGNPEHGSIILIRRTGKKIELVDPATHAKLKGELIETPISESVFFKFEDEWKRGAWQGVPGNGLEFRRSTEKGAEFTAYLTGLNGQALELMVEPLLSVWACSNHNNPTHTADSQEQMTALTAKNGCIGWHKLDTSGK